MKRLVFKVATVAAAVGVTTALYMSTAVSFYTDKNPASYEATTNGNKKYVVDKVSKTFSQGDLVLTKLGLSRVVAKAGDVVEITQGKLFVNKQQFYTASSFVFAGDLAYPIKIENGFYFLLNDNYEDLGDSRTDFSLGKKTNIKGKLIKMPF